MKILIAILLFIVTFLAFVYIADAVVVDKNISFDTSVQSVVDAHESPVGTSFMDSITFFGSHQFLIPAYLLLIFYYVVRKRFRLAANITAIGLTSTGVLFLLKDIFQRQRPLDPLIRAAKGFSFPSGHSFSSFTFYGVLIYLVWRLKLNVVWKIIISVLLFLFAAFIAYSRVYLRVHYPSDVLAGFCLSIVWLTLAFILLSTKKAKEIEV